MRKIIATLSLVQFFAGAAWAQQWETGGGAGWGIYRDATVFSRAGTGVTGVRNRYVLTAALTENRFSRVSGELRYTYHDGDPFLRAANQTVNVEGQSHAIHYDALIHLPWNWSNGKLRAYGALGGGAKIYRVSGPVDSRLPLGTYASFRHGMDTKPMLSVGAGLRYQLRENVFLRFDFRDYVTQFPGGMVTPAAGGNIRGIMHQFTPMVGISIAP